MLTNILIGAAAIAAAYYFFKGNSRKRISEPQGLHSGSGHDVVGYSGGNSNHLQHGKEHVMDVDAWIDPVCGMPVETDNAVAKKRFRGQSYYFCSEQCQQAFIQNPAKYTRRPAPVRQSSHGGGHGCCG